MKKKSIFAAFALAFVLSASASCSNSTSEPDDKGGDKTEKLTVPAGFALGADVSWITQYEAQGKTYQTTGGQKKELMQLLHDDYNMNAIRLRVFVNPKNYCAGAKDTYSKEGFCGKDDVVAKAKRAAALGMDVMIDFHYSDYWADPSKQYKPLEWENLTKEELVKAIADHTQDVLNALKTAGVTPKWVQIGNETRPGMLWDTKSALSGATWDVEANGKKYPKNFKNLADYINSGYAAAKSVFPSTICILHLDNGYDSSMFNWWFDEVKKNGAKWDMIGMSLYPYWAAQDGHKDADKVIDDCIKNIKELGTKYNCDVMIVETGMQAGDGNGGMASKTVLAEGKRQLKKIISETINNTGSRCKGVLYWEPECAPKEYQLGAFDFSGKGTAIMDAFVEK